MRFREDTPTHEIIRSPESIPSISLFGSLSNSIVIFLLLLSLFETNLFVPSPAAAVQLSSLILPFGISVVLLFIVSLD